MRGSGKKGRLPRLLGKSETPVFRYQNLLLQLHALTAVLVAEEAFAEVQFYARTYIWRFPERL